MKIEASTRVFGVLGRPVRHSLSPRMHNAWFQAAGIDAVYLAFQVPDGVDAGLGASIRRLGLAGVNLTVPFKATVVPELDAMSPLARVLGAVNVVVVRDGRLEGTNTDAEGFARAFEEEMGPLPAGGRAMVLGAGGAGRAVAAGLASRGLGEVLVANRTLARAEEACARLGTLDTATRFAPVALDPDTFGSLAPSLDLVVNATAGGARDAVEALPVDGLRSGAAWSDINYWMDAPPRLDKLRALGVRFQDGVGMLVHQGALSFLEFTGSHADPALARALIGRGGER